MLFVEFSSPFFYPQEMTVSWCIRRAELVFKCVKGKKEFHFFTVRKVTLFSTDTKS